MTGIGPTLNEAIQVDDSSKTQAQGTSGETVQNIRLSLVVIFFPKENCIIGFLYKKKVGNTQEHARTIRTQVGVYY